MNGQNQNIPVSQAVLDAHTFAVKKCVAANIATLEAIQAIIDFNDPLAANLFGCNEADLKIIAEASRAKIFAISSVGIPLWTVRIASPEFKSALEKNEHEDSLLQLLLKTFNNPPPISSLA